MAISEVMYSVQNTVLGEGLFASCTKLE